LIFFVGTGIMAATLNGSNDDEKLQDLLSRTHKDQAIWFLNVFWNKEGEKEAERIWNYVAKFNELDMEVRTL